MFIHLSIIAFALCGLGISFYIFYKKRTSEKLVCPVGMSCDRVTHSDYAVFLGIPLEYLGLLYYGTIAAGYGTAYIWAGMAPQTLFLLFGASLTAFLFSLYLTFIQAFVIREWCSWCLTSAFLSTAILAGGLSHAGNVIQPFLAEQYGWIILIHILSAALGWATANVSDVFFFKFLRDGRISERENDILKTTSQIIWFALILIIGSGIALVAGKPELLQAPKFIMKMIVVGVIIANGALLNLLVAPKLVQLHFGKEALQDTLQLRRLRTFAFTAGGVSAVSWYTAFLLPMTQLGWSLPLFLQVYMSLLLLAMMAGRLLEAKLDAQN